MCGVPVGVLKNVAACWLICALIEEKKYFSLGMTILKSYLVVDSLPSVHSIVQPVLL